MAKLTVNVTAEDIARAITSNPTSGFSCPIFQAVYDEVNPEYELYIGNDLIWIGGPMCRYIIPLPKIAQDFIKQLDIDAFNGTYTIQPFSFEIEVQDGYFKNRD